MKSFFVIVYHLFFLILSMVIIAAVEGIGKELFMNALYFNLLYLAIGGVLDYVWFLLFRFFFTRDKPILFILHFLACLLLINAFSFYFEAGWITLNLLSGLFANDDGSFVAALCIHAFMIGCYYLAILATNKWFPNKKSPGSINSQGFSNI